MSKVNITELRQNLPAYLEQVRKGAEFQVTVHGRVVARLVPELDEQAAARAAAQSVARKVQNRGCRESPASVVRRFVMHLLLPLHGSLGAGDLSEDVVG